MNHLLNLLHDYRDLLIVICFFAMSAFAAWLLFRILESHAEGTKFRFRLGGALAGFVVVYGILEGSYLFLHRNFEEFNLLRVHIKFHQRDAPPGVDIDKFGFWLPENMPSEAWYAVSRLPGAQSTPVLHHFDDYFLDIPYTLMNDKVRVYLKMNEEWWSTDEVQSTVRHLRVEPHQGTLPSVLPGQ